MLIPQNLIATASPQTLNHSSIALNTTEPHSPASNFVEASEYLQSLISLTNLGLKDALFFLAYLLILYALSLWDYWIILRVRESCNRRINSKTTLSYINYGSVDDGSVPRTTNSSDTLSDDSRSTLLPDSPPRQSPPLSEIQH
ncbi:hypothetical protein JOM56_010646 [Amanita muscaria]